MGCVGTGLSISDLWSGWRGARGDSWVTPSVAVTWGGHVVVVLVMVEVLVVLVLVKVSKQGTTITVWLPTNRSSESWRKPSAKLFL